MKRVVTTLAFWLVVSAAYAVTSASAGALQGHGAGNTHAANSWFWQMMHELLPGIW